MAENIVIIGAGQAGIQAVESLRKEGFSGPITMVGDEAYAPYQRPPLSKDFLLDKVTQDGLVFRDEAFFKLKQIDLMLETRVHAIDRHARRLSINGNPIPSVAVLAGLINLESLFALGIPACDFKALDALKAPHKNSDGKTITLSLYEESSTTCKPK